MRNRKLLVACSCIVGAFITGTVAYTGEFTFKRLLTGALCGLAGVYVIGMAYFYISSTVSCEDVKNNY